MLGSSPAEFRVALVEAGLASDVALDGSPGVSSPSARALDVVSPSGTDHRSLTRYLLSVNINEPADLVSGGGFHVIIITHVRELCKLILQPLVGA